MSKIDAVKKVLKRHDPGRFIYAPNYWQWFSHQLNHNIRDPRIKHCESQLDFIEYLGLDVFSRNIYANPRKYWFGGLTRRVFDRVIFHQESIQQGDDTVINLKYETPKGVLEERLRYILRDSTLVQEKYLLDDPDSQLEAFEFLISDIAYRFIPENFIQTRDTVGDRGVPIAGEFFSPLKMLHLYLGPVESTYLLTDQPERMQEILAIHEERQLELVGEMMEHDVPVLMSMDNLDSMFHPPHYVEQFSASFYEKASGICHLNNGAFFIHACGQQRANLKLISSLGVDGLEGVAYPPLGDVELEEAMALTDDGFIITGGISAAETTNLKTRDEVFRYSENLFRRMKPYRHRFMLSASCNTSIDTSLETILAFRDAWLEFGQ